MNLAKDKQIALQFEELLQRIEVKVGEVEKMTEIRT